jgi:probable rRNA maturation factor
MRAKTAKPSERRRGHPDRRQPGGKTGGKTVRPPGYESGRKPGRQATRKTDKPVRKAARKSGRIVVAWDSVIPFASDAELRRAASAARKHAGCEDLQLSIVLCGDARLARLHALHLGDPSTTDVITFDLSDEVTGPAGEIYASAVRARNVARDRGVPKRRELALYVVHGVLHLCGHDDRSRADRTRMRAAETKVLRGLGWSDDTLPHDA